jgi:alpha-glucosidase (family GH31 glycosyl hydrolase)
MEMLPYIHDAAEEAGRSGKPLMRPVWYDYPGDVQAWHIADQHMFGPDMLVAPLLSEGSRKRRVYLPSGNWVHLWTGESAQGAGWIGVSASEHFMPVFYAAGSPASAAIAKNATALLRESGLATPDRPLRRPPGGLT